MQINTRDFGSINISDNEIISFPNGVFAFEDNHRFVLISPCGENKYPMWLQSLDSENLCFIVFDPREFAHGYSVSLDKDSAAIIDAKENDALDYLVISVIPEDYADTTVNMKSPIVVNSTKNKAAQVISADDYPIKFPLFRKEGA